jgi:hypothetical protein
MPSKNFTNFNLKTDPLSGDFIVGYNSDGSAEFKLTISKLFEYFIAQLNLTTTTTTTTPAPTTTTTTTTTTTPAPDGAYNHLFTSSSIPINISYSSTAFNFSTEAGNNPNLTLTLSANYDFNINSTAPFAIRVEPVNTTTNIADIYNNDIVTGVTNKTLMYTPKSAGILFYVNTLNPTISGRITII